MSLPSMFADKLTREEMDKFKKAIRETLIAVSEMRFDDVQFKNDRMKKYTKANAEPEPGDDREQNNRDVRMSLNKLPTKV
jgi:septin family protein